MDWTITVEAMQRSRSEVMRKRLAGLHPICKHLRLDMPLDAGATCGDQNRSAQPGDEDGKGRRSNWPAVPVSVVAFIVLMVIMVIMVISGSSAVISAPPRVYW